MNTELSIIVILSLTIIVDKYVITGAASRMVDKLTQGRSSQFIMWTIYIYCIKFPYLSFNNSLTKYNQFQNSEIKWNELGESITKLFSNTIFYIFIGLAINAYIVDEVKGNRLSKKKFKEKNSFEKL